MAVLRVGRGDCARLREDCRRRHARRFAVGVARKRHMVVALEREGIREEGKTWRPVAV